MVWSIEGGAGAELPGRLEQAAARELLTLKFMQASLQVVSRISW